MLSINSFDSKKNKLINKIDSIIEYSIKEKAFPGAQIIVLKDGEAVSYTHLTLPTTPYV